MDRQYYFLISALILVGILLVVNYIKINDEGYYCLKNPLSYGAEMWSRENNKNFSCTCLFDVANSPTIWVNRLNVTIK